MVSLAGSLPDIDEDIQILLMTLLCRDYRWSKQVSRLLMHQMCHPVVSVYQGFQHAIELVCPILKLLHIRRLSYSGLLAFFKGFLDRHPVFAPSTTPIYSNVAFQILAYALENMTNNKSFGSILSKKILKPLHMDGTSISQPKNASVGAIPGNIPNTGWDLDVGEAMP